MNKILIIIAVVVAVLAGGFFLLQPTRPIPSLNPQFQQNQRGEQESGGYGFKKPFYRKDGISTQHYWPGEGSFSNEETEILLFNDTNAQLQVRSFSVDYQVGGRSYPQKSATWEKFINKQSWDRIEYLNISQQYYKGEPLVLTPGQKGKLHWHIAFGDRPLTGKQTVKAKLTLLRDGQTLIIEEEFNRESGFVRSSDEH